MSEPPDDYRVDLGFSRAYCPELNPLRAKLALLKAGLVAPDVRTACDLGFGQGVSLAIHAAASRTVWYGNDLNPEHVAGASALIAAAGVDAHLYPDSFADFAERTDLPDFDFVGLSGIWSWVSDRSRADIVAFLRKRLKAGGVFYLDYMALPGWAPYAPLRELLARHAEGPTAGPAPSPERIENSLDFVRQTQAADSAFFADNPAVTRYFSELSQRSHRYLAHAFFNRHCQAMYFSTAAALLAEAGLTYVGRADIGALQPVYLTRAQQTFLGGIDDPDFREFVHDFLVNRLGRRDLFVKGQSTRLNATARAGLIESIRVVATTSQPGLPLTLRAVLALNGGPAESAYGPLLQRLSASEPVSLATVAAGAAGASLDGIFDAALLLAGQSQLDFVQAEEVTGHVRARTAKLNGHLLSTARTEDGVGYLASPLTGAGVAVARREQLFLLAVRGGADTPEALAAYARSVLTEEADLLQQAGKFLASELPLLKPLGVA